MLRAGWCTDIAGAGKRVQWLAPCRCQHRTMLHPQCKKLRKSLMRRLIGLSGRRGHRGLRAHPDACRVGPCGASGGEKAGSIRAPSRPRARRLSGKSEQLFIAGPFFALRVDDIICLAINNWRNTVIRSSRLGFRAVAAAAILGLGMAGAEAQTQPAPAAPAKTAPAKAAPAAKPEAPAKAACKGMAEAACGAAAECQWIAAKKTKPYCKSRPKAKGPAAGPSTGAAAPAAAKGSATPPPAPAKK